MEDSFELPVIYKGKEIVCHGRLVTMGYTYKIFLDVDGQEIIFEPDEERNLRAITENQHSPLPGELIRIIGETLQKNLV